jgi:hypothetical protein
MYNKRKLFPHKVGESLMMAAAGLKHVMRFIYLYIKQVTLVGFEVFTPVVMKSIIFWDVTPCSLLSCNRRFGGTYRLHLQD